LSSIESRHHTIEDPGHELIDKATSLWGRYGRIALGVLGAIVVIGVVGWLTIQNNRRQEEQASEKLANAQVQFIQLNFDGSLKAAEELHKAHGSTPSGIDALRLMGDSYYWRSQPGDFDKAAEAYKKYLAKNNTGLVALSVKRSLAYALESAGKPAEAAPLYDQLVGAFDRESSAEMLSASARCLIAAGKRDDAAQRLDRLVKEFGETSFSMRARIVLAELRPPAAE
jgi:tetratricopeptide (TPR) repeat protein